MRLATGSGRQLSEVAHGQRQQVDLTEIALDALQEAAITFVGSFVGYSTHLDDAVCLDGDPFTGSDTSGVSFLDRRPDFVFQYVFVHELGHYFGLCHVDGLNRIMYTSNKNEDKTWWSWMVLPEYIYLEGGPRFVLDEAKRAWDGIVGGYPTDCLTSRAH